jgi:hypothetical protein
LRLRTRLFLLFGAPVFWRCALRAPIIEWGPTSIYGSNPFLASQHALGYRSAGLQTVVSCSGLPEDHHAAGCKAVKFRERGIVRGCGPPFLRFPIRWSTRTVNIDAPCPAWGIWWHIFTMPRESEHVSYYVLRTAGWSRHTEAILSICFGNINRYPATTLRLQPLRFTNIPSIECYEYMCYLL